MCIVCESYERFASRQLCNYRTFIKEFTVFAHGGEGVERRYDVGEMTGIGDWTERKGQRTHDPHER